MDINDQKIKEMIEKKVLDILESGEEQFNKEYKVVGEGATIHIHHDHSLFLFMYLYLMSQKNVPETELKELQDYVAKLEKKTQEFNETILSMNSDKA